MGITRPPQVVTLFVPRKTQLKREYTKYCRLHCTKNGIMAEGWFSISFTNYIMDFCFHPFLSCKQSCYGPTIYFNTGVYARASCLSCGFLNQKVRVANSLHPVRPSLTPPPPPPPLHHWLWFMVQPLAISNQHSIKPISTVQ
jgi:hypothetical protein